MIKILPFKAEHISQIKQQNHDLIELQDFGLAHYRKFEGLKWQWSIEIDGEIKACCGCVEYWKDRGEVWAMIDRRSGPKFLPMVRALKDLFNQIDCQRIEVTVISNFIQAHRLVKILGFTLEAPLMKKYGITGWDYSLYSRVK